MLPHHLEWENWQNGASRRAGWTFAALRRFDAVCELRASQVAPLLTSHTPLGYHRTVPMPRVDVLSCTQQPLPKHHPRASLHLASRRFVILALLFANALIITNRFWHDHEHHEHGHDESTCPCCLVIHQPALPSIPQALIVVESPIAWLDCDARDAVPHVASHAPTFIRGPPAHPASPRVCVSIC